MDIKIPFESKIKFNTPISEITKMSLEHEFTLNNETALGNFLISGEYKSHEVSINKDEFNYTLPFQVDLADNIDPSTVEFDIEDFSYDVVDSDTLNINITYRVTGEEVVLKRDDEFIEVEDVDFDKELDSIEDERLNIDLKIMNEVEEVIDEENEERIDTNTKNAIIDSIEYDDDNYVTYHVHIVKESETIESISMMYNTNSMVIGEYNDITELQVGDKIIIPFLDE